MYDQARQTAHGMVSETLATVGKASPPIAVSAATIAGVTLQDWVLLATLVFTLVSLAHLVWKWLRELRGGDGGDAQT